MKYNTAKKTEIIEFLKSNPDSLNTAEDICRAVLKDGRGKSTVYRILSDYVEDGTVKRVSDSKSRRVTYQYIGSAQCHTHLHLKCQGCGRLIHLDCAVSQILEKKLFTSEGFALDVGSLLYGRCNLCIASGSEEGV